MNNDEKKRRELGEKIFKRHRNFWVYTFYGFIAALINTVVYMIMHNTLHTFLIIDNTVAFIISNLASFWFNNKAVFKDNVDTEHSIWHKLISFFAFRIISLIPDTLIMWLGVTILKWPALLVKIIDQVLVGIFNYLTTRSVFQKQESTMIERIKYRLSSKKDED